MSSSRVMPHQTVADSVAAALRKAIIDGELPGGHALRQEDLAREYGASRVPIREALLKLEAEGLVVVHPRRGVVVSTLSANDFEEILEMRCALEALALELSIPKLTGAMLEEAQRILDAAKNIAILPEEDVRQHEFEARWGSQNWAFHQSLYLAADRPRLLDTIENLHLLFARHLRARPQIVLPASDGATDGGAAEREEWAQAHFEHEELLQACSNSDVEAAIAVLHRHIRDHGRELVRRLKEFELAPTVVA